MILFFFLSGFISTDVDIQTRIRRSRERMRRKEMPLTSFKTGTNLVYFVLSVPQQTLLALKASAELFQNFLYQHEAFFSLYSSSLKCVIIHWRPVLSCYSSCLYGYATVTFFIQFHSVGHCIARNGWKFLTTFCCRETVLSGCFNLFLIAFNAKHS